MKARIGRRTILIWVALVCLIIGTFVVALRFVGHESLESAAHNIANGIIERDAHALMRYALDREIKLCGLTEDNLKSVLERLIPPKSDLEIVDRASLPVEGESALSYTINVKSRSGGTAGFEVIVSDTEDGPRAYLLDTIICCSFVLKYGQQYENMPQQFRIWHSIFDGLQDQRTFFEGLGLKGFMQGGYDARLHTWENMIPFAQKAFEASLAIMKKKRAAGKVP